MLEKYDQFIAQKVKRQMPQGFEAKPILAPLFDWQKFVVRWALKTGRAALFEDCGLGKTLQQLEWAKQVSEHTGGAVLILTPLAVARQTEREAIHFGYTAKVVSSQSEVTWPGVFITNYDKLEHFDPGFFMGVVLDESSLLKAFTGKTRIALTEAFGATPYRLCCTATPSPNDYTEFGQHAAFLGVCTPAQMLSTFFINDTFNTGDWRLKGHAEADFWKWLASWACCVSKPSDIGFSDEGYVLPMLHMHEHVVEVDERGEGEDLFRHTTLSATTMHREMRLTSEPRAAKVAELVNNSSEPWLVWCNTNDEADKLAEMIPSAVEIRGSETTLKKELAAQWFKGEICLCNCKEFRTQFAAWETQNISENTTSKTKNDGSKNLKNTDLEILKSGENISATTTHPISTNGPSELQKNSLNITPNEERNIRSTNRSDQRHDSPLNSGTIEIRRSDSPKGSNHTESHRSNTERCFQSKGEDVLYADCRSAQIMQSEPKAEGEDSTSITATKKIESEDYFAPTAIWESESSSIIQNDSKEPRCICGQRSGKRSLISKSSMFGYGLNLQICSNVAFVGLSYSFEDFYQALRRSYRFGQKNEVHCHIIRASTEEAITRTIKRKIAQHEEMQTEMKKAAAEFNASNAEDITANKEIQSVKGDDWTMYHGDCVRIAKSLPNESIDLAVFSPPFADLFTYSDDIQDMGNCDDLKSFTEHFDFLIEELARVMVPGREVAVHCVDLLSTKWKHGKIEFQDFSGEIIRAFWRKGFLFHSRICIWKSPVTEMQRTKAHGLLYKTLKADSCDSRVGCADYLLVFRKPGENPKPVTKDPATFPVELWQEYASPVWMTVDQGNVLNRDGARDDRDERHICPLQLDVIDRAVILWSNPGDTVFSPFAGIGSEGYQSVKRDRKFIGAELKESYFKQACENLKIAKSQMDLFPL